MSSANNHQDTQEEIPDHLRLAAHWASTSIETAQSSLLSTIEDRIQTTTDRTNHQQTVLKSIESQYKAYQQLQQSETQALAKDLETSFEQIDRLGALVDAVEKNLDQLEVALGNAESAVGLTLGGRLEQLATRFFGTGGGATAGAAESNAGVPYLRQWAPKEQGIPKIISTTEYLSNK
ncbi:hypothetical protein BX661DRAFT_200742 [Kickxella alabastrina]|uniref:uncharacterized protein n=1 Tax=Kickxella alabastrina TaxID=61397 RepID=UPI0022210ADA|nr:uncharacterized protein BX661DRAFT_200742 [Kickxella alabastrina]KAI7821273.1 hypothetical protein BX661DRAFT_200742 [Kickxella alabastrina]